MTQICFKNLYIFYSNDKVNKQNHRYWSSVNPRIISKGHKWVKSLLLSLLNNTMIGFLFFDSTLNNENHLEIFQWRMEPRIIYEWNPPMEIFSIIYAQKENVWIFSMRYSGFIEKDLLNDHQDSPKISRDSPKSPWIILISAVLERHWKYYCYLLKNNIIVTGSILRLKLFLVSTLKEIW